MTAYQPTARSKGKRAAKRVYYDEETVHGILDAAPYCHVGYVIDGQPYVTPTIHWRRGRRLFWHGSSANRMIRTVATGMPVCVTVSLIDGYVLGRSGFHHSVNYRSVMAFGTASLIEDAEAKDAALRDMMEDLFPGRWDEIRGILPKELKATSVVTMEIEEASAKARSGQPIDDEEDYALSCWAGVLPMKTVYGPPEPDPRLADGIPLPEYLKNYT